MVAAGASRRPLRPAVAAYLARLERLLGSRESDVGSDVLSTKIELVFDYVGALNDEQRAAITHQGGSLRVLAGAGTGKTTTLTTRVAWLLASGTPPERVLLLTFTRRAARAMLTRTDALLRRSGTEAAGQRVVGGTFHAVAHRTLRRHADPLGLPDGFSVIDTSDAADVLDLVRDDHLGGKAPSRRFPRKTTLQDLYSRAVNTGRPISAVIGDTAPWATQDAEAVAAICKAYVARKRALGLLDFDDLLLYWRAAVRDDRLGPRLASRAAGRRSRAVRGRACERRRPCRSPRPPRRPGWPTAPCRRSPRRSAARC